MKELKQFRDAISAIEATLRLTVPYNFLTDPAKAIYHFEETYRALKRAAQQTMQNGVLQDDVQIMLADCANKYRSYSRQISEARDPTIAIRRKKEASAMRHQDAVDEFVLAEVSPYWDVAL